MIIRSWWLRRSLRFRITVGAAAVAVAFLLLLAHIAGGLAGSLLITSADTELRGQLDRATAEVRDGRPVSELRPDGLIRVLDTAGDPVDGRPKPPLAASDIAQLKAGAPLLLTADPPPRRWIGTVVSTPDGTQRLVVVSTELAGYYPAQQLGTRLLSFGALLGGLVVGSTTWFAVSRTLRPVERLRAAAARLPVGDRLPVPEARDELRDLAEALNALLARRDEATSRLRRFTGDAAHELRSPVTSIRTQAEVAVVHPNPALAQDVLADIVTEAERLSSLVVNLLTLARSDAGELPSAQPIDLAFAAEAAIGRLSANGPLVRLIAPATRCAVWAADSEVELVLDNLLRNATQYARAQIVVSVLPAGRTVRLLVDDDGPGITAEHRAKVFDRFYRVADDRSRHSGGAGLGLALVAEVVRRRQGAVRVAESPEGGARFEIRWPAVATTPS